MNILLKAAAVFVGFLSLSSLGGYVYFRQRFQPPPNQLVVPRLPMACTFEWVANETTQPAVPHIALLLPVTVAGCPRTCYLQFDTGAPTSALHSRSVAALHARYPGTATTLPLQGDTVHEARFTLGTGQLQVRRLQVIVGGAATVPADSTTPFVIGTLGSDVLEGRVLVLDYVRRRFGLYAQVPDSLARKAVFAPLSYANRRLLISAGLQGQPEQLLFDTGTSAFGLITSQPVWQQLARPAAPAQIGHSNAMGRKITTYTTATAATMRLGAAAVPLRTVTYMEGVSPTQNLLMRFSGLGGMLGNAPFETQTIIVDTPGKRFGLLPGQAVVPNP